MRRQPRVTKSKTASKKKAAPPKEVSGEQPEAKPGAITPRKITIGVFVALFLLVDVFALWLYVKNSSVRHLRYLQQGDKWTYAVTGQVELANGHSVDITNGTCTRTVEKITTDPKSGTRYLRVVTNQSIMPEGTSKPVTTTKTETLTQDPSSNDICLVGDIEGDNHTRHIVMGKFPVITPGQFSATTKLEATILFNNGDSRHLMSTVVKSSDESTIMSVLITTPAGTFTGWNYHTDTRNRAHHAANISSGTDDDVFVPYLGSYATEDSTEIFPSGATFTLHKVLTGTTVK